MQTPTCIRMLVLALLALGLGACSTADVSVRPAFHAGHVATAGAVGSAHERGVAEFAAGRYGLAVQHFRNAVASDGESVESLNGLAATYDRLGRYDLADRYYRRALARDAASAQTLNNLGFSALLQRRFDLAVAFLKEAQELDAGNQVVATNLREAERSLAAVAPQAVAAADENARVVLASTLTAEQPTIDLQRRSYAVQRLVTRIAASSSPAPAAELAPPLPHGDRKAPAGWRPVVAMVRTIPVKVEPLAPLAATHTREATAGPLPAPVAVRPDTVQIVVSNGAGRNGMAARMRAFLGRQEIRVQRIINADRFGYETSVIFYRPGSRAAAADLAKLLPVGPSLVLREDLDADVLLRVGTDLLRFDSTLARGAA